MNITFRYLSTAILSFIGGIQFHRGWTLQRRFSRFTTSLDSINGSGNNGIGHRGSSSINDNNDDNDGDENDNNDGDENENGIGSVARRSRSINNNNNNNNNSTTMTTPTNEAKHSTSTTTTTKVRIILLGERHSGTNWITDHLKDCFQGKAPLEGNTTTTTTTAANNNAATATAVTVTVTNEYTRYKHWYQEDTIPRNNNTIIVVIVLFRDPIDWIEAMRYEPHHAHDHIHFFHEEYNNIQQRRQQRQQRNRKLRKHPSNVYWRNIAKPLSWKEFVTRPWMGQRGPKDMLIRQQIDAAAAAAAAAALQNNDNNQSSSSSSLSLMNDIQCMDNYQYVDATPCSIEDVTLVKGLGEYKYEYYPDKSERGYSSILQLRSSKIRNHLSIRNFTSVNAYLPYQFEGLKINGTMSLINEVQTATGLVANCNPIYGKNSSRQSVDGSIVKEKMIGNNNNNDNNNMTSSSSSSSQQQQQRQRRQLGRKKVTETRELPIEYIHYMNRNVNWDVERLIGYFPRIL